MRILLAAVLLEASLGACAAVSANNQPMRVEVWRGGDDGLTSRLADAMEDAFKHSHRFVLSSGNLPGTLIASIPTNVPWKEVNGKTRVLYTIDFTDVHSKKMGQSTGQCWDDQLQKCADAIVGDAARIADKIR
jgi:hypothetical protein